MTTNITIVADQEAFFADAATHTHPPNRWIQVKRYLSDPVRRIDLHDLISDETERLIGEVSQLTSEGRESESRFAEHMSTYEAASARLITLLAAGAFFSKEDEHDQVWLRCMERLATYDPPNPSSVHSRALRALQLYPCLLALYSITISATAARRLEPLTLVLKSITVTRDRINLPIGYFASLLHVFGYADKNWPEIQVDQQHESPWSGRLFDVLRPAVAEIIPDENKYEAVFNEAEYVLGLVFEAQSGLGQRGPIGRIVDGDLDAGDLPTGAMDEYGDLLIESGIFNSRDQIENLRANYDNDIQRLSRRSLRRL